MIVYYVIFPYQSFDIPNFEFKLYEDQNIMREVVDDSQ